MTIALIEEQTATPSGPHPALEKIRPHFASIRAKGWPERRSHGMRESQTAGVAAKLVTLVESAARAGIDLTMLDALFAQELGRVAAGHGGESAVGLALHESYSYMGLRAPAAVLLNNDLGEAVRRVEDAERAIDRLAESLPDSLRKAGVLPPGRLAAWLDARRAEAVVRVREGLASGGYADVASDEIRAACSPGIGLTRRIEVWRVVGEAAVLVPPAWPDKFLADWCAAPVVALGQFGVGQFAPFIPPLFG